MPQNPIIISALCIDSATIHEPRTGLIPLVWVGDDPSSTSSETYDGCVMCMSSTTEGARAPLPYEHSFHSHCTMPQ
eukprot:320067-Pyramimonas_sp.AAC.2